MSPPQTPGRRGLRQALGPGIMYAGAAIGVSHLVQSTRAGAEYGFGLLWAVVVVHLFKYPFFEYAHRYAAATGESLLGGYRRLGRWALLGYLLIAFASSIPTAAVLTVVTAGMAAQLFGSGLSAGGWAVVLLIGSAAVLGAGGYPLLDRVMKVLMAFLALCTLVALAVAAVHGRVGRPAAAAVWSVSGITFLLALMGWMPTPVDASVWPSLWLGARVGQTGYRPALREALFDFKLGYWGSLVTALMFVSLGALVMFGTGEPLEGRTVGFAAQFVGMYVRAMGPWSRPLILTAAFATMLSTLLTVLDGYPRVLTAGCRHAWPRSAGLGRRPYFGFMSAMMLGALLIFACLTRQMRTLVDAVTVVAFLSAPLLAYLNCRVIAAAELPAEAAPPGWLRALSWAGLVFLTGFSILFLATYFIWGR